MEVRFPPTATKHADAEAKLRAGLRADFPLVEKAAQQSLVVDLAGGSGHMETQLLLRYSSRDRTASVAVAPDAVIIETTRYLGFDWYLDLISGPIGVVADTLQPDGITGMGHRFIDEVRVPDATEAIDWSHWIDGSLLTPSQVPEDAGLSAPDAWQGVMNYRTSSESTLTLRYGPMDGVAVPASGSIRRDGPPPSGPFFLLDWDSRRAPEVAPELTVDEVLSQCETLYRPVRAMFHHLTTDHLREVFSIRHQEDSR